MKKVPIIQSKSERYHLKEEQEAVRACKQLIVTFEQKIKDKISEVWGE